MASPPPPSSFHPTRNDSSEYYYYYVVAVAAVAVLILVSNMIAVGWCSSRGIVEAVRRFLRSRGLLAGEINDERKIPELIPVCKYRGEQDQEHECSVCLSVFVEGEEVRQLPKCKHSFHAPCIDMWLHSHSNCPLCRADVLERSPPRCRTAAGRHPIGPRGTDGLIAALM